MVTWSEISVISQIVVGALPLFVVNDKLLRQLPEIVLMVFSSFVASILLLFLSIFLKYNLHVFIGYLVINAILTTVFFLRGFKINWYYLITLTISIIPLLYMAVEYNKTADVVYSMLILWICTVIRSIHFKIQDLKKSKTSDETSKLIQGYNTILFFYTSASVIMTLTIDLLMTLDLWAVHNFLEILSKIATTYVFWRYTRQIDDFRDSKNHNMVIQG